MKILPTRAWFAIAAIAVAISALSGWTARGWREDSRVVKELRADRAAAAGVVASTQAAAQITEDVGARVEVRASAERIITRDIIKEVRVYVPVEVDRQFSVPLGFVRLHDAAAQGSAPAFPDGPGQSVDSPSGLALSAVAGVVADNYGSCRVFREQLIGWQSWYAEQSTAWTALMQPLGDSAQK